LEIVSAFEREDDRPALITVMVAIDESVESAINYFENNGSKLADFIASVNGFDPYLEIFVNYKPTERDSQQSELYNLELINILSKYNLSLLVTVHKEYDEGV